MNGTLLQKQQQQRKKKKYIIFTRAYNFKRKLNEENLLRCLRVENIVFIIIITVRFLGRLCK